MLAEIHRAGFSFRHPVGAAFGHTRSGHDVPFHADRLRRGCQDRHRLHRKPLVCRYGRGIDRHRTSRGELLGHALRSIRPRHLHRRAIRKRQLRNVVRRRERAGDGEHSFVADGAIVRKVLHGQSAVAVERAARSDSERAVFAGRRALRHREDTIRDDFAAALDRRIDEPEAAAFDRERVLSNVERGRGAVARAAKPKKLHGVDRRVAVENEICGLVRSVIDHFAVVFKRRTVLKRHRRGLDRITVHVERRAALHADGVRRSRSSLTRNLQRSVVDDNHSR